MPAIGPEKDAVLANTGSVTVGGLDVLGPLDEPDVLGDDAFFADDDESHAVTAEPRASAATDRATARRPIRVTSILDHNPRWSAILPM